jgi:hypothetical protein
MSKVKMIPVSQLVEILWNFKVQPGAAIMAGVTQMTEPKMNKKGNPYYGKIVKVSTLTVLLNTDYEKGVLNQLEREGKEATEYQKGKNTMPLIFGDNNRFIGVYENENGAEYVLQYRPFDNSHPVTTYLFEGQEIDKKEIEPWLPKSTGAQNQGTEKEIFIRKVYLKNILNLNFNGEKYQLIHPKP